jgi:hypothetical protein
MKEYPFSLSSSGDLLTKRHLPPQMSRMSQDAHGSPIVTTSQSELGILSSIEPMTEKPKSMDTGHAEILPSGMTAKKSIPEPHRKRDLLPDSSESITPMNGTIPPTWFERAISSTHESTSEEMPELYAAIHSTSPGSVFYPASQNMLKLSCQ